MMNINDLANNIDILRTKLMKLIDEKEDLLDYEVLNMSRQLDKVIVDYNKAARKIKNERNNCRNK
jgi:hypothetical protein